MTKPKNRAPSTPALDSDAAKGPSELAPQETHEGELDAPPRVAAQIRELLETTPLLQRGAAMLLVGYLRAREPVAGAADPDDRTSPEDLAGFATRLMRRAPMVWNALRATDYIRMARMLAICGLPVVPAGALQDAIAKIEAELAPPRPLAPAPAAAGDDEPRDPELAAAP